MTRARLIMDTNNHGRRAVRIAALLIRLRRITKKLGPGVSRKRRASIAIVGGAVIAMLATMAAVAVDLGNAYLAKVDDQRAADSAAYAGALAYNAQTTTAAMNSAVGNLATLNGFSAGAAAASLVPSPSGDGNSARAGDRHLGVAAASGRDIPQRHDVVGDGNLIRRGQAERACLHNSVAIRRHRSDLEWRDQRDRRDVHGRLQRHRFGAVRHDDHHQDG